MAKVGYLGHSCFTLDLGGVKLLLDPFITPNPKAANIDVKSIQADYILVSHGHQDHLADLIDLAKQTGATILANFEITTWAEKQGCQHTVGMNYGGTYQHNDLNIKVVNAIHSSSFADGTYAGNPVGFVIWDKDFSLYFAGDTGLCMDMKLIKASHNLDLAILPIGDRFTMGIEDAVIAADFIGTTKIIGMHFDTFPPIEIDHQKAKSHFKTKGKELILMSVGEEQTFNR